MYYLISSSNNPFKEVIDPFHAGGGGEIVAGREWGGEVTCPEVGTFSSTMTTIAIIAKTGIID